MTPDTKREAALHGDPSHFTRPTSEETSVDQTSAREVVTEADQLPLHPNDEHGRYRRGRGRPRSAALVEAIERRQSPARPAFICPGAEIPELRAALRGQGEPAVPA